MDLIKDDMNIQLPKWEEINERFQRGEQLNSIEQFIYDDEPAINSEAWRASLKLAIQSAWMIEKVEDR